MSLNGWIRNTRNFSCRLAQTIPNKKGNMQGQCPNRVLWDALDPPDTMRTSYTPTVTAPTRRTRTWQNVQSGQFKSTPNSIQKGKGTVVPIVSNMEKIGHPQPQLALCFQRAGISHTNFGMRKD